MTEPFCYIEEYALHNDLEALVEEWHALLNEQPNASLYESPLWVLNYGRYRKQAGVRQWLLAVRAPSGRLIGVLPLAKAATRWRFILPTIRASHDAGEYESDWIIHSAHTSAVVHSLCQYLEAKKRVWYQLKLNSVWSESPTLSAIKAECERRGLVYRTREGSRIPYVKTEEPAVDALQLTTAKYRRELKRRWRKLNELGSVYFEAYDGTAPLDEALDEFIQVEASGWKGETGGAIACQSDAQRFWRQLAFDATKAHCLRLHFLRLNGRVIAGQLGINWGRCYYCLKVGYDPQFQALGPGALMTQHVLQQCIENPGVDVYDFAGYAKEYMWNWTHHYKETQQMIIGSPHWLKGDIFKIVRHASELYRWGRKNLQLVQRMRNSVGGIPIKTETKKTGNKELRPMNNSALDNEIACEAFNPYKQPKNILVVGVPRSGTSLTSAIFTCKGYYVGWIEKENARLGDEGNPFGYFEADDVIARNVEILHRVGFSGDNTWLHTMISREQIRQIDALEPSEADKQFLYQYQEHAPWVWKDPRLTLTLPYWWKMMDPRTTGVVFVHRDPEDSYQSFIRLRWYEPGEQARKEVLNRIDIHLNAASQAIEKYNIPHISVHYDEYLNQPEVVVQKISAFSGLRLEMDDLNVQKELNHSSRRDQFVAWVCRNVNEGGLRFFRVLKPLVPESMLAWLLPEKKYVNRIRRSR